jgi:hypothetical protein
MNWTLAFIVPTSTPSGVTRKLVFENEQGDRATMLAGPWAKRTKVCKGTIDGAAINSPVPLTVSLRNTEHGQVLIPQGLRLSVIDPVVTTVEGKKGADGKVLRNLAGGVIALSTFALVSEDDEPALVSIAAPVATVEDEPALS